MANLVLSANVDNLDFRESLEFLVKIFPVYLDRKENLVKVDLKGETGKMDCQDCLA